MSCTLTSLHAGEIKPFEGGDHSKIVGMPIASLRQNCLGMSSQRDRTTCIRRGGVDGARPGTICVESLNLPWAPEYSMTLTNATHPENNPKTHVRAVRQEPLREHLTVIGTQYCTKQQVTPPTGRVAQFHSDRGSSYNVREMQCVEFETDGSYIHGCACFPVP